MTAPADPAREIITDALFYYRDPPGRRLWGKENSEARADNIIAALHAAGYEIRKVR